MTSELRVDKIHNEGGDNDSGLDMSTNDVVAVKIAGSEKVRVHSDGKLGVGETAPLGLVHTKVTDVGASASAQGNLLVLEDTENGLSILSSTSGAGYINFGDSGDNDIGMIIYDHSANAMKFFVNASERMRIDSSGEMFLGCTGQVSATVEGISTLHANDDYWILNIGNLRTSSQYVARFYNQNGLVGGISTSSSSTAYNTSSDYRLKENVTTSWDATSRLKQLKPSRFNFKADKDTTLDGFLAHEVSSIVPESVTGTKDEVEVWKKEDELPNGVSVGDNKLDDDGNTIPVMQAIDQSKLVPLLVKTIQELEARIAALEAK